MSVVVWGLMSFMCGFCFFTGYNALGVCVGFLMLLQVVLKVVTGLIKVF